jgi:hypothetical protein
MDWKHPRNFNITFMGKSVSTDVAVVGTTYDVISGDALHNEGPTCANGCFVRIIFILPSGRHTKNMSVPFFPTQWPCLLKRSSHQTMRLSVLLQHGVNPQGQGHASCSTTACVQGANGTELFERSKQMDMGRVCVVCVVCVWCMGVGVSVCVCVCECVWCMCVVWCGVCVCGVRV